MDHKSISNGVPDDALATKTSVATRLDVLDLMARYAWALDTGDIAALANLFTEDGEYFSRTATWRERSGIREFGDWVFSRREHRAQHWAGHPIFYGDGDVCYVRSMGMGPQTDELGSRVSFVGYYDDVVKKIDDEWLFARRIWRFWSPDIQVEPLNDPSDLLRLHRQQESPNG